MDTTIPPTLFERMSGGRFMDISLRYGLEEIQAMRRNPFITCPCCHGTGSHMDVVPLTVWGLAVIAINGCEACNNTGLVSYECPN